MWNRKKVLLSGLFFLLSLTGFSQQRTGTVDVFMGVDFNYRDIYWNNRVYDVLVNLTPGFKWNMGHRWEAAALVHVPVYNDYGDYYKYVRLYMATLSKQMAVGNCLKLKATGGLFGSERYGIDLKGMLIANDWLAFTAQVGLTGHCSMAYKWNCSKMGRFTGLAGAEVYLHRWNTQLSAKGGRFVYGDYGIVGEGFRHFKHVSVGVYAEYSNKSKENGGFKVVVMLPPYKRSRHRVNFRPASNFRLTYNIEADPYSNAMYKTDPEENERGGWFDRDLLPWGQNLMAPDFVEKGKEDAK